MVLTGKRRHYITIQSPTRTADGQGGYVTTWSTTSYEWSQARTLSQSRTLEAGGIQYRKAVEFLIRSTSSYTLTTANRIVWEGENYTIHSIVPSHALNDYIVLGYA